MNIESAQYVRDEFTNENTHIRAVIEGAEWILPINSSGTRITEILRQVEAGALTIAEAE